ncbi:DUF4235 domain-containing protein [Georgenia wangjunii]|uniref:DUF4235 domain-containing protein n=1 Tax=Georgenia wangjunii TaxID=3117730 RepID=UPI002F26562B
MDIGWKLLSTASILVTGTLVHKAIDSGWKAATGHEPPKDPDDHGVSMTEVILFAIVSGAVVEVSRRLALRGASKWYGGPVDKHA